MSEIITPTLVINFTEDDKGTLIAEVDDRQSSDGGYNDGDTRFRPGDNPVFLLFHSSNVAVALKLASDGALSTIAYPVVRKKEQLQYANAKSAELRYPYHSGFQVMRRSPSMASNPTLSSGTVSFGTPQVGIVEVEYYSRAEAIRLSGAAGDLPVVVYIEGIIS